MNKHKLCSNVVHGTVNVSYLLVLSRLLSAAHVLTICQVEFCDFISHLRAGELARILKSSLASVERNLFQWHILRH